MLERLERRFEIVRDERSAPKGTVDWADYARRQVGRARFLDVPCRFPELRDDPDLKAGIRFTLEKHRRSLEGQRTAGIFVLELIEICHTLLERVRDVAPREPGPLAMQAWSRGSLRTEVFRDGLQAIGWTVEDRGLAGLSDLQGLPWAMSMEAFFEAWAETILSRVARKIGGVLKTGRQRQTVAPLNWQPPYLGSQKYLLPDLFLERGDTTLIVDAKYKDHWEEMQEHRWGELEEQLRERHREDLLQVLAYSNLALTPRVLVCLAYPCLQQTWESLRARQFLFHRASLTAGSRRIDLLLTAFPLSTTILEEAVTAMSGELTAEQPQL